MRITWLIFAALLITALSGFGGYFYGRDTYEPQVVTQEVMEIVPELTITERLIPYPVPVPVEVERVVERIVLYPLPLLVEVLVRLSDKVISIEEALGILYQARDSHVIYIAGLEASEEIDEKLVSE